MAGQMSQADQQAAMAAANMQARQLVVNSAVKRTQQIYSNTINTAAQTVLNIPPRNVGLILGFIVNVRQTVTTTAGAALTLTPFGAANLVGQFAFFDLNNNTRIQTPGWHINAINSVRGGIPYLAVDALSTAPSAYPVGYGSYYDQLINGTATIATSASGTLNMTYFVPLAYSDTDLRGAVFANVVNATMNLQITLNQDLVAARTLAAWANSAYCTATSGTAVSNTVESDATVTVFQVYYDQLPQAKNGGPVLPWLDLQTVYDIKQTALQGVVAAQDFPISYANYRDFLSTCVYYVNKSDTAGAFGAVADLNYISLQSANYTEIFKVPPYIAATWARTTVGLDFPRSGFYIPTRNKPISTVQWGNINLILNAADVQTGAFVLVAWEAFALTNYVGQGGSLAAN